MKQLLFLFIFLVSLQIGEAQNVVERKRSEGNNSDVYALSLDFAPPANSSGYEGSVTLRFAFRNCTGPSLDYVFVKESLTLTAYWHQGQRYPSSNLPAGEFKEPTNQIDLKVHFVYQSNDIGSMTFTDGYLGRSSNSVGCLGNGVSAINVAKVKQIYKSNPQSWFDGLQIGSVELDIDANYESWLNGHLRDVGLESWIEEDAPNAEEREEQPETGQGDSEQTLEEKRTKEEKEAAEAAAKEQENAYQGFLEEARNHEQNKEYLPAINAYQKAYNLKPAEWITNKIAKLEELEELARKNDWTSNKREEQRSREEAQTDATIAQVGAMAGLATILFKGLGEDGRHSAYQEGSWHLRAQLGFNCLTIPVIAKHIVEYYDNGPQYQRKLSDYEVSSPGIQGGVECWPLFKQNLGLGFTAQTSLGMWSGGVFSSTYEVTGVIYLGSSSVRLESRAGVGKRSTSIYRQNYSSLTEAESTIDSRGNYNYTTMQVGLRIMFDAWDTRAALRLLGLIETGSHTATGALVELDFNNRISIMARYAWKSERITTSFDNTNDFRTNHSTYGQQLELVFVRNFDFHRS